MIKILKSNNPINFAFIFLIMLLLWAFKFIYMPTPIESYEYHTYIFPQFGELMVWKYLSAILAFFCYYIFAILIIKTNSDLTIVESAYQTPGLFFAILTGLYINVQRIIPEMVSGLLIYLSLLRLLYSYKHFKSFGNCFDSGFLFGLTIIISYKFIFFFPILIIGLVIVRPFKLKEFISMMLGILSVLFITCSLIYLYADFSIFKYSIIESLSQTFIRFNKYNFYIFLPLIILSIIVIVSKFTLNIPQNIFTRKAQNVLIISLIFSLLYFLSPIASNESVVVIFAPLSLLISNIFVNTSKSAGTILFYGILFCILFLQIIQFKIIY